MIGLGGLQIAGSLEFGLSRHLRDRRRSVDRAVVGAGSSAVCTGRAPRARPVDGRRLDDVVTTRGGSVQLDRLDALRHPPDGDVRIGVVTGIVSGAPERGEARPGDRWRGWSGGSELSTDPAVARSHRGAAPTRCARRGERRPRRTGRGRRGARARGGGLARAGSGRGRGADPAHRLPPGGHRDAAECRHGLRRGLAASAGGVT